MCSRAGAVSTPDPLVRSVAANLEHILAEIEAAIARSDRPTRQVTVVGASKFQSRERMLAAYHAGLRVFGENRVQEAVRKQSWMPDDVEWHLIGPLQSNKARAAVDTFSVIQSVDRLKIARALQTQSRRAERPVGCLLEFNLGEEASKHGFLPSEVDLALEVLDLDGLEVRGLMAIPPHSASAEASRSWFRRLRQLLDELRQRHERCGHWLSMGMSNDYVAAVEEGATHVRIGTALFGDRDGTGS